MLEIELGSPWNPLTKDGLLPPLSSFPPLPLSFPSILAISAFSFSMSCASLASSSVKPPLAADVMGACFLAGMGPPAMGYINLCNL